MSRDLSRWCQAIHPRCVSEKRFFAHPGWMDMWFEDCIFFRLTPEDIQRLLALDARKIEPRPHYYMRRRPGQPAGLIHTVYRPIFREVAK